MRRRYLSLTATDRVALILVVEERPGSTWSNPVARLLGLLGQQTMFLPVVDYTEGYGFTYGGRASLVEVLGRGGRVSVPATWGGTKQIGVEVDKPFATGVLNRVQAGVTLARQENPHFEVDDRRTEVWMRVDRRLPGHLRISADARWADVRFGSLDDTLTAYGATLALDTRRGTAFPRDDVYARAGFEWLNTSGQGEAIGRPGLEVEAYKGLVGQTVLALRGRYRGANRSLPSFELPLLGGGKASGGGRWGRSRATSWQPHRLSYACPSARLCRSARPGPRCSSTSALPSRRVGRCEARGSNAALAQACSPPRRSSDSSWRLRTTWSMTFGSTSAPHSASRALLIDLG